MLVQGMAGLRLFVVELEEKRIGLEPGLSDPLMQVRLQAVELGTRRKVERVVLEKLGVFPVIDAV